ncbi:MAG: SRPBCC family protein [Acidimicrobiales bacterium]|jgi:carbon monoxide dehydrogenase subunit G
MQLEDSFEVPLPVAEAWGVLTDIERITPYLPGIWLLGGGTDEYLGVVKVKLGPVTVWYEGAARYLLLDADAHRAVLKAEGGEIRGQGNGTALVTASLSPSPRGTRVEVVTVLSIDGKLAQFAFDKLASLSRSLIAEFAENLEFSVLAAPASAAARRVEELHQVPNEAGVPKRGGESAIRRLTPVLTVAGTLLVEQIVVHWLRPRWSPRSIDRALGVRTSDERSAT